jgi:hypothetical protein
MFYLNPEFQRKYGRVVVEKDKLQVVLDPNKWGRNIFLEDGIWNVRNDFVAIILGDLLKALGIDVNNKDAQKIRQRVLTISDNQINIEFLLPQEVKAELKASISQEVLNQWHEGPYLIKNEIWKMADCPDTPMGKQVYNSNGDWIGPYDDTKTIREAGLLCEKSEPTHCVCSIGFNPQTGTWHGWSHRAMTGYKIGDVITPKDSGWEYQPDKTINSWKIENLEQARKAATYFAKSVSHFISTEKERAFAKVIASPLESSNEKVLWKNKWLEVYEQDGWYTCVRSTVGNGVCVLPYRKKGETWEILIRCEHTPCHEDGPRVKGKFNKTSLTGQIEKGYDALGTAEKELHEESGYAILQKDFIDLGWVYPTKSSPDKCFLFGVSLDGAKEPDQIKGDGTKGEDGAWCEWVSLEEALGLPSASMSACIAKLCQQHKINL